MEADSIMLVTDRQYGATFTGATRLQLDDRAIVFTVRDDATMAERIAMAKQIAAVVAARKEAPAG